MYRNFSTRDHIRMDRSHHVHDPKSALAIKGILLLDSLITFIMCLIGKVFHRTDMHDPWLWLEFVSYEIQRHPRAPIQWDEAGISAACTINITHNRHGYFLRSIRDVLASDTSTSKSSFTSGDHSAIALSIMQIFIAS